MREAESAGIKEITIKTTSKKNIQFVFLIHSKKTLKPLLGMELKTDQKAHLYLYAKIQIQNISKRENCSMKGPRPRPSEYGLL